MSGEPLVTERQVRAIAAMADPVQRNYLITQSYHDFSRALARALGDSTNVNWSTFACWASDTAGKSIRSEELPAVVKQLFAAERRIHRRMGWVFRTLNVLTGADPNLIDDAARAAYKVSKEVGKGNLKVYAELGPIFARFIAAIEVGDDARDDELRRFFGGLRDGRAENDGQQLLKQAFRHYADARRTENKKAKAELMLLGNCLIGWHEQTRLQPNIKNAVDAPVTDLLAEGVAKQWPARIAFAVLGFAGITRDKLFRVTQAEWERLVTRYAMDLALPNGTEIPLGGDHVPWPNRIPDDLQELDNPELIRVLSLFDDNIRVLKESGADNWTDLQDRMAYIVELFRSQQQDARLFESPFPNGIPGAG